VEDGRVSRHDAVWWAVTIDSTDPGRVASFWSRLLETPIIEPGPDRPDWLRLQPLGPAGPFLNFQPVDEPKAGKVRLHLDVLATDLEALVQLVLELGGTDTGAREELPRGRIAVMTDVDGNEFCLLAAPGG
jgi:predicted enzyme related to lactoylglutathione lyase